MFEKFQSDITYVIKESTCKQEICFCVIWYELDEHVFDWIKFKPFHDFVFNIFETTQFNLFMTQNKMICRTGYNMLLTLGHFSNHIVSS